MLNREFLPPKRVGRYLVVLQLSLIVLSGCGVSLVYQDRFDSTPIGGPPGPPEIGTSSVGGDVRIAQNPFDAMSADRWLQLRRVEPLELGEYVATLEAPVRGAATVALVGYIPASAPITMSVFFNTPAFAPAGLTLLHIDLLPVCSIVECLSGMAAAASPSSVHKRDVTVRSSLKGGLLGGVVDGEMHDGRQMVAHVEANLEVVSHSDPSTSRGLHVLRDVGAGGGT